MKRSRDISIINNDKYCTLIGHLIVRQIFLSQLATYLWTPEIMTVIFIIIIIIIIIIMLMLQVLQPVAESAVIKYSFAKGKAKGTINYHYSS